MNKKIFLPSAEKFVRQIVKLSLDLPQDKIGSRAKRELITSSTLAASNLNIAIHEIIGKNSVSKLNLIIEQIEKCNFWLKFLNDEGILSKEVAHPLIKEANVLSSQLLHVRQEDEKSIVTSYPGEWFLDD